MANTDPGHRHRRGVVEQVWRLGRDAGPGRRAPDRRGHRRPEGERARRAGRWPTRAARVRVFSDDGHCVTTRVLMRRALEYVKAFDGVIAQHAQEPRLTEGAQMHEGERLRPARAARLAGGRRGGDHRARRAARRARRLPAARRATSPRPARSRSSAGPSRAGIDVTAEVTPHHLMLTDDLVARLRPGVQGQPAAAHAADVEALREGAGRRHDRRRRHRPRAARPQDKDCECGDAAFGMTRAGDRAVRGQRDDGRHRPADWAGVARVMSSAPGRGSAGSTDHGRPIAVGEPANLTLVDPRRRGTVDREAQASLSRNTPFAGGAARRASSPPSCAAAPPCSTARWRDPT